MYYDEKYHCPIIWGNCYDHTKCPECTEMKKFIDAVNRREDKMNLGSGEVPKNGFIVKESR